MRFTNKFPFTNINDINLDWIIKRVKELGETVLGYAQDIANAVSLAEAAQEAADSVTATAESAVTTAQAAEATANAIAGTANSALSTAQASEATAQAAETTANAIAGTANSALATAQAAETTAQAAETAALAAEERAENAETTAGTASANASNAVQTANTALATTQAANTTANNAETIAGTASVNASNAVQTANTALATAQQAHVENEHLSDEVAQQKSAINAQAEVISTEDVFAELLTDASNTVNGVSYTLNSNTLSMLGTASRNSVFTWATASPVPDSLKGKTVFVHINTAGNFALASGSYFCGIRYKTPEITSYTALQNFRSTGVFALQIPSNVSALQFRTVLYASSVVDGSVNVEIVPAYDFNAISRTIRIKYESGNYGGGTATERLHIYVPAETGYILYLMYHFVDTTNNSNVWQIYNAYQVDDNFDYNNRKTLTITGEWECAIHLNGRHDFSGGHTHGDEMMQSVVFLKDGVPVNISNFSTLTACNEFRIIRSSTMYDPADNTTAIAEHGVEYVYTYDGVSIEQSIKWLVAEQLTECFLCMFLPSKAYIDRGAANSDFVIETLSSEIGTPLTTVTKPKSTSVAMWDTAGGMFANVAVPVYPTGLTGGDKMIIHDNGNKDYNKVYYYVCNGGSSTVGELWKSKSIYKIGYKSVT